MNLLQKLTAESAEVFINMLGVLCGLCGIRPFCSGLKNRKGRKERQEITKLCVLCVLCGESKANRSFVGGSYDTSAFLRVNPRPFR